MSDEFEDDEVPATEPPPVAPPPKTVADLPAGTPIVTVAEHEATVVREAAAAAKARSADIVTRIDAWFQEQLANRYSLAIEQEIATKLTQLKQEIAAL